MVCGAVALAYLPGIMGGACPITQGLTIIIGALIIVFSGLFAINQLWQKYSIEMLKPITSLKEDFQNQYSATDSKTISANIEKKDLDKTISIFCAAFKQTRKTEENVNHILNNMRQMVFLLDSELNITATYSPYVKKIFGSVSLVNENIMQLLFAQTDITGSKLQQTSFHLAGVFKMSRIQWQVSSNCLVKEGTLNVNRHKIDVRFTYFPSYDDNELIEKITLVVDDITEYKKATQEIDKKKRQEMEKIFTLLEMSDSIFNIFIDETNHLFSRIKKELADLKLANENSYRPIIIRMFRDIHTIKGTSSLFKFNSLKEAANNIEEYLIKLQKQEISFDKKVIGILTDKLVDINGEIYSYASLRRDTLGRAEKQSRLSMLYRVQWIKSLIYQLSSQLRAPRYDIIEIKRIEAELSRSLSSFHKSSLIELIEPYNRMINEIAKSLGKKVAPIKHELDFRYFETNIITSINDILVHCVRNSLDHGIELPSERIKNGKPEIGKISISSKGSGDQIHISVTDDGRGVDPELVAKKAIEKNIIDKEKAGELSDKEKLDLIYHPGFSTAERFTEISGCGIGMDSVKNIAQKLRGTIEIDTQQNKGTTVTLKFNRAYEEVISDLLIFDVSLMLKDVVDELAPFFSVGEIKIWLDIPDKNCFIFGDRISIREIIRSIFIKISKVAAANTTIKCDLRIHAGRRYIDSHKFFSISFKYEYPFTEAAVNFTDDSSDFKNALFIAKQIKGSVIIRDKDSIDINIPSNIPVEFSAYEFRILVYQSDLGDNRIPEYIAKYFNTKMGGWKNTIEVISTKKTLGDRYLKEPTIVILDAKMISHYENTRSRISRDQDRIILISNSTEGVDLLENSTISPKNLIFTPTPIGYGAISNVLEKAILDTFANQMIRESRAA